MKVDVLLGLQWGDEGKGKVVDVLTPRYDIIARFQGGANAGHTLEMDGFKHVLHLIPSGIFHADTINIIGNGVIIDPFILAGELQRIREKGFFPEKNLLISKKSHLILPSHRLLDAVYESAKGKSKIGSTLKGIGPTYTDKTSRNGLRIGDIGTSDFKSRYEKLKQKHFKLVDLYRVDIGNVKLDGLSFEDYEQRWFESLIDIQIIPFIDSEFYINNALSDNKRILAEGAQGTMLDVDFGTYPFVTSSNTICAGVCSGLGIAPRSIGNVYGIVKAYCTRVGSGPFPTELNDESGDLLRDNGNEYGSTTGRPRRCGWLDLVALNYAIMLNGVTHLMVTKADVLSGFDELQVCTHYRIENDVITEFPFDVVNKDIEPIYKEMNGWSENLQDLSLFKDSPQQLFDYLRFIEEFVNVPVAMVSVGADRKHTLFVDDSL